MRRAFALVVLVGTTTHAYGDANDLVISRLALNQTDGMGNVTSVVPQNADLRSLSSQLGVVLAPHLLSPADTVGFGGFQLSVDYATTTIDANADYWRARESGTENLMRTVGFFMHKGTWFFPAPSFEAGAGAVHLIDSHTWTGQLYAKVALHEGYHQLPIPSLAFRGAVSRMMNQRELDLTVISLDLEVSKHLGIGSTWRFDPYGGWNVLLIVPRSEVIDPTPSIDPLVPGNEQDILLNFVFKDQDNIIRHRFFAGAKLQYYVFQLTLEAQFAMAGKSLDDRSGTNNECMPSTSTTTNCDAKDAARSQRTLALSAGFSF